MATVIVQKKVKVTIKAAAARGETVKAFHRKRIVKVFEDILD